MKTENTEHRWRFFRVGGIDQVRLDSTADLVNLEHLDPKLWVALSCPVQGLEFPARTLELVDTDGDIQVHPAEVMAAVDWAELRLKDLADLIAGGDELPLAAINDQTEEGQAVLTTARRILANLGKPEAQSITIADASDLDEIFHETSFNGDGIIPVEAAGDDEQVRRVLQEIIDALGPEDDRSGAPGVSQEKADRFFAELRELSQWQRLAEDDADNVMPFGDDTAAIAAAVETVLAKADDYFARCRLAAYDPRALAALNRAESEYLELLAGDLSVTAEEIATFPLARIEAGKPLPLGDQLNPAWESRVARMVDLACRPLFGADKVSLSSEEWNEIKGKLAAYRDWHAAKPETAVALGFERARAILAEDAESRVGELIVKDRSLEGEVRAIEEVEQLARYLRDLYRLLTNFVSFRDFYDPDRPATFQTGTLYIDGRACELCLRVEDHDKHAKLAAQSGFFLAYCDCVRAGSEPRKIVAAVTDGEGENLRVGRNGLFYDRDGKDWDATITKTIPYPISLGEAFWSPYKRVAALVEEQVEKFAADHDEAVTTGVSEGVSKGVASVGASIKAEKPEPPPFDIAKFAGIFAAIGLALGAIATAIAAVLKGLLGLELWQMPLAIAGLLLAISGPATLLAAVKLRRRNLGPVLNANGWAVNDSVLVNSPFGASLTHLGALPPNASRSLRDPFPKKRRLWPWLLLLLALLAAGAWWLHDTGKLRAWGLDFGQDAGAVEDARSEPDE